jgi:hypothetical protein
MFKQQAPQIGQRSVAGLALVSAVLRLAGGPVLLAAQLRNNVLGDRRRPRAVERLGQLELRQQQNCG